MADNNLTQVDIVKRAFELQKNRGGRPRAFKSVDDFNEFFIAYVEWCARNPVVLQEGMRNADGERQTTATRVTQPLTLDGFCVFAGIGDWSSFKKSYADVPGFAESIALVMRTIREQQIKGAAVGMYKENLVSRLNGLTDSHDVSSKNGIVVNITGGGGKPARTKEDE